ncbi:MAG TPA: glycosyltransferase family 39 protein, partial [Terriglobia bacterium]|nr:glycosyltransferase family 39 protein [Terriglobia bacterium]
WLDEANSIVIAQQDVNSLVERLRAENNLPAYYLILRQWIAGFGDSEASTRLLSGVFYVASILAVFWCGRTPHGRTRDGLYSAFFYLISSQAIHQAQNIRMYSMLGCVSALSMLFFLRLTTRADSRARDGIALALVNAIGSLTHMWFFFLIGAQALSALLFAERRRGLRVVVGTAASVLPFLLLWLPALSDQLRNGATDWMPPFQWVMILDVLIRYYGGVEFNLVGSAVFYGACVVLLNRMGRDAFGGWTSEARLRLLAGCFLLSLAAALAVCAFIKPIYFYDRYTIIALPALALLLGDALSRFSPRLPLVLFCYTLLAAQITMKIRLRDELDTGVPSGHSDRRTAEFIVSNVPRGDVLVFTSLSRLAIDYYLQRFGCGDCFREISFPSEIDRHPSWRSLATDPATREAHASEARQIVDAWRKSGSKSVWLLYGADTEISRTLKDEIEKHYVMEQEIPLQGPYHFAILRYRPAGSGD